MKNYYTTAIVALTVIALALGGLVILQKNKTSNKTELPSPTSEENGEGVSSKFRVKIGDISQKEFAISVGENTQIFGIAKDDPYYGEPPAPVSIGGDDTEPLLLSNSFEIFGDVVSVNLNDNVIRISTDYARPLNTAFTPRGPRVSLQDIKVGDRIVANGAYDKNGEANYSSIKFIQISPSVEEIKALREVQEE